MIRKQIRCSRTPNRTAEVLFAGTIMLCVHGPETLLASSMRNWPSFAELSNHVTWIIESSGRKKSSRTGTAATPDGEASREGAGGGAANVVAQAGPRKGE
ncbi:MAG: hypothetical protein E6J85_07895 [Deltaproteobacteria bacterium]|nr:MAG: hypothetical protein E6J85_07895 [Deltaproteobacteria bacterium]